MFKKIINYLSSLFSKASSSTEVQTILSSGLEILKTTGKTAAKKYVDEMVKKGTITQEQADLIKSQLK